jgi:hypothetical protein
MPWKVEGAARPRVMAFPKLTTTSSDDDELFDLQSTYASEYFFMYIILIDISTHQVNQCSKWKKAKEEAASAAAASGGGSVFSNINLSKASSPTPAPSPAAPLGKPKFAMPTLPTYNITTSIPSLSFGSTPTGTATATATDDEAQKLLDGFSDCIKNTNIRSSWKLPMTRFVTTMSQLQNKDEKENQATTEDSVSSKPLFPSVAGSPPPVEFSFGSTASALAPSTTPPTFSFGSSAPAAAASPAPAPSGFSFAPPPKEATPTFSFNSAPAPPAAPVAAPTTATTSGIGGDGVEVKDEEPVVLASADEEWNLVYTTKVKAYHHRDGPANRFATDALKVQQHKTDSSNRRMVMRDATGKVLMNLKIAVGMTFQSNLTPGKGGKKSVARIIFYGLMEEKRGAEMFTLICKAEDMDALHSKLEEMAK